MYFTAEEAIKGLRDGKRFENEDFFLFRDDVDVAMVAVKKNGMFLKDCSDKIKDNPKVVKAAVQQIGWALEHASPARKDDPNIVLEAVKNSGYSLQFASEPQKNNKLMALAAVINDPTSIECASKDLQDLCKNKSQNDMIMTLYKAIEAEKLYKELEQNLTNPSKAESINFAKKLSQECKEHAQSQAMEQSKTRVKMKI